MWVVSMRSTIRRADAATSSSATRAPADGATVRTASAQPTTARAVGTAVRATKITKIRLRKGVGQFFGVILGFGARATIRHREDQTEFRMGDAECQCRNRTAEYH